MVPRQLVSDQNW